MLQKADFRYDLGQKTRKFEAKWQKWEVLAILSILILPYTDGFLGPPNLAICTFFKFCPDSLLKSAFLQRSVNIWGRDFKTGGGAFWQFVLKSLLFFYCNNVVLCSCGATLNLVEKIKRFLKVKVIEYMNQIPRNKKVNPENVNLLLRDIKKTTVNHDRF